MVGSSPELAIDGDSGTCARTPRTAAQRWWQVAFTRKALVRTVRIVTDGQVFLPSYFDFTFFSRCLPWPCSWSSCWRATARCTSRVEDILDPNRGEDFQLLKFLLSLCENIWGLWKGIIAWWCRMWKDLWEVIEIKKTDILQSGWA